MHHLTRSRAVERVIGCIEVRSLTHRERVDKYYSLATKYDGIGCNLPLVHLEPRNKCRIQTGGTQFPFFSPPLYGAREIKCDPLALKSDGMYTR
jgi:hypothetical protein